MGFKKKYVFPAILVITPGSDLARDVIKVVLSGQDEPIDVKSTTIESLLEQLSDNLTNIKSDTDDISANVDRPISSIIESISSLSDKIDTLLKYGYPMRHNAPFTFIFLKRYEIADGSSKTILFENPSNSDKTAFLLYTTRGQANADIDTYINPEVTDYGTEITDKVITLDLSYYGLNPRAKVYEDPTISGDSVLTDVLSGGLNPKPIGDFNALGEVLILPPKSSVAIKITNTSGVSSKYSVKLVWYEE